MPKSPAGDRRLVTGDGWHSSGGGLEVEESVVAKAPVSGRSPCSLVSIREAAHALLNHPRVDDQPPSEVREVQGGDVGLQKKVLEVPFKVSLRKRKKDTSRHGSVRWGRLAFLLFGGGGSRLPQRATVSVRRDCSLRHSLSWKKRARMAPTSLSPRGKEERRTLG